MAGLSISAPADRLDESWLSKLQSTAQEISGALGFNAARPAAPPPNPYTRSSH